MKTFLLLIILTITQSALARKFVVVERSENNKQIYQSVELQDLESTDSFDGKYFKIVKGKSNEAVSFLE